MSKKTTTTNTTKRSGKEGVPAAKARPREPRKRSLRFDVLSIFPGAFDSYLEESLLARARKAGIVDVRIHDIRGYSTDRHHKVDDRPFGGGPGMVMKIEPIWRAVEAVTRSEKRKKAKMRTILFSTRGKKFDAKEAQRLAKYDRLVLICGRYEGVDERVAQYLADEEISMGDYVLSGGELPAMILIEAVGRFVPGFLGKQESLEEINGSFPTYTRPEVFRIPGPRNARSGLRGNSRKKLRELVVPKVLVSGDHAKIGAWRRQNLPPSP